MNSSKHFIPAVFKGKTRPFRSMVFYLMALTGFAAILSQGHAAEILASGIDISLKGEIVPGDYDRFVEKVINGGFIKNLILESPGGDAIEAIKIGRLVRESRMKTLAPMRWGDRAVCHSPPRIGSLKECNCSSSCFLIFAAGIEREGNSLGIHRVFVNHEQLRQIAPDEAAALSDKATNIVSNYLKEMGVPTNFVERLMAIPSNKIEWVSEVDVKRYFSGYIPEYSEWVAAKCKENPESFYAELIPLQEKKNKNRINAAERRRLDELTTALVAESRCRVNASSDIRQQAGADVRVKLRSIKNHKSPTKP